MQLVPEKGITKGLFTTCSGGSSSKVKCQVSYQMFYKYFYMNMLSFEASLVLTSCVTHRQPARGRRTHPLESTGHSAHIHRCFAAAVGQEGKNPPVPTTLEVVPSFQAPWEIRLCSQRTRISESGSELKGLL